MARQKHIYEYMRFRVNVNAILTSGEQRLIDTLKMHKDKTVSLKSLGIGANDSNKTKRGFKGQLTRVLNKNILQPINRNFNGEGIYLIKIKGTNTYKIGYGKNIAMRLKYHETNLPAFDLVALYTKPQYSVKGRFNMNARNVETIFKEEFIKYNAKADLFDKSEFIKLESNEVNQAIKTLNKLLLMWSKSYEKLKIDFNSNGEESYIPVSSNESSQAIKYCRILESA